MHVDVSTGMAYVHVSPPTIRTLSACIMSLAPAKVCANFRVICGAQIGFQAKYIFQEHTEPAVFGI